MNTKSHCLEKSGGIRLARIDCDNGVKVLWYNVSGKMRETPRPDRFSVAFEGCKSGTQFFLRLQVWELGTEAGAGGWSKCLWQVDFKMASNDLSLLILMPHDF